MAKAELPREVAEQELEFDELISTLDLVEGEPVIVRLDAHDGDDEPAAGVASIVGELRHEKPARYEGHEFSVGSPYPDRYPERLAGGIIFLDLPTFNSATLTTFDGNDYFVISIKTHAVEILLQSADSTYP